MQVSHETIYQSLFVQARGALRRDLAKCLRTGRARRRIRGRRDCRGELRDIVVISERPAEVADRAVPGHWEGDLIMGAGNRSAIVTLVERQTRYRAARRGSGPTRQAPPSAKRSPARSSSCPTSSPAR